MSGSRPRNAVDEHDLVEIAYDDGYPAGYTKCDNRDIWEEKGKKLTFAPRTLGVWLVLISLRGDWVFNLNHLRRVLGMGRDTLRMTLAELEAKGRLERTHVRKADGTFGRQRWVIRRGGIHSSPPSPPAPPTHATQSKVSVRNWNAGDEPAPEIQAMDSASAWKSGSGSPGAGISVPLVTTGVVPNTEATTTTSPTPLGLVPPASLPPSEARVVVAEVQKAMRCGDLRADFAQPILDELEGAMRRGQRGRRVEKPVSYLRSLLKRAQGDEFIPDAGLPIERERQKQALEMENRMRRAEQRRQDLTTRDDPETRRRIREHIADFSRTYAM